MKIFIWLLGTASAVDGLVMAYATTPEEAWDTFEACKWGWPIEADADNVLAEIKNAPPYKVIDCGKDKDSFVAYVQISD